MSQAICHPERPMQAKGLCPSCYNKQMKETDPSYAERQRENSRKWSKDNPKLKAEYDRDYHLRTTYGITMDDYKELFDAQNGLCAICNKPPVNGRNLDVDHDHETNEVRGLLCTSCNRVCGYLDNKDWLDTALKYLRKDYEKINIVSNPIVPDKKPCRTFTGVLPPPDSHW